jgi:hypothetical protein
MADVNVEKLTDEQIDEMGQDDLDRIVTDEETGESILRDEPKPKADDQKETPPKADDDDEKPPAEGEEKKEGDDKEEKPKDDATKLDEDRPHRYTGSRVTPAKCRAPDAPSNFRGRRD